MPEYAVCRAKALPHGKLKIKPVAKVGEGDVVCHQGNRKDCVTFLARHQGESNKALRNLPPE